MDQPKQSNQEPAKQPDNQSLASNGNSGSKLSLAYRLSFGFLVIIVISLAGFLVLRPAGFTEQPERSSGVVTNFQYATTPLETANGTYRLQVADTPEKQELGLGRRDRLGTDQGMVFPYDAPGVQTEQRCFWMQGMRFPIDIIWLDASKQIVTVKADVSPDTYPETFCPTQPSQYVIELNAGEARKAGLQTGQTLRF